MVPQTRPWRRSITGPLQPPQYRGCPIFPRLKSQRPKWRYYWYHRPRAALSQNTARTPPPRNGSNRTPVPHHSRCRNLSHAVVLGNHCHFPIISRLRCRNVREFQMRWHSYGGVWFVELFCFLDAAALLCWWVGTVAVDILGSGVTRGFVFLVIALVLSMVQTRERYQMGAFQTTFSLSFDSAWLSSLSLPYLPLWRSVSSVLTLVFSPSVLACWN